VLLHAHPSVANGRVKTCRNTAAIAVSSDAPDSGGFEGPKTEPVKVRGGLLSNMRTRIRAAMPARVEPTREPSMLLKVLRARVCLHAELQLPLIEHEVQARHRKRCFRR